MSPILVPSKRPWTQQPHLPAALSPRCAGALVIDGRFDRIVGGRPASTKQLGFGLGSQGISARASGTGSRNDYPVPPTLISSSGDFTLALFLEQKSAQSGIYVYAFGSPGYPIAFAMRHSATSYNADLALGGSTHVNTGINASAAGVYRIVARRIAGTIYFNINGQKSSVANATTLGMITSLILNSYTNTSDYGVSGETNFYLALLDPKRGWSDAEADAFIANPWSIYRARDLETIFDLGAGGGVNITATLGSADASGFAANVNLQRTITAALTTADAYGFIASVNLQRNIAAQLGNADAFGLIAGVDLRRSVIAMLGAAVASGYDATVSLAGALNIPASLGVADAIGRQASVNLTYHLNATLGSATAIGFDATVSNAAAPFTQAELDYLLAYMQEHLMVPTAEQIAAAVLAAMQASPPPVNNTLINGAPIIGDGTPNNPWRAAGVQP